MEKGRNLAKQGDFGEAEVHYRKAINMCEALFGKGSPESGQWEGERGWEGQWREGHWGQRGSLGGGQWHWGR